MEAIVIVGAFMFVAGFFLGLIVARNI